MNAANIFFNSSGNQELKGVTNNNGFTTALSNKPFSQPWQPKNKAFAEK
jgi:hypothetical protein